MSLITNQFKQNFVVRTIIAYVPPLTHMPKSGVSDIVISPWSHVMPAAQSDVSEQSF